MRLYSIEGSCELFLHLYSVVQIKVRRPLLCLHYSHHLAWSQQEPPGRSAWATMRLIQCPRFPGSRVATGLTAFLLPIWELGYTSLAARQALPESGS